MRFFNYIKKYSDFYLSKYSVTKRKFEDILKQKLKKDFLKKYQQMIMKILSMKLMK